MRIVRIAAGLLGALLLVAPAALDAQYDLPEPKPQDRIIATFGAETMSGAGHRVRFHWTIQDDDRNEDITCTIDVESDAMVEESIEDCDQEHELVFSYEEPGTYRAVLVARSRAGGSDQASTVVTVD